MVTPPRPGQSIEVRFAPGGRGGNAPREWPGHASPGLDDPSFFLIQVGQIAVFADFRQQAVVAVGVFSACTT